MRYLIRGGDILSTEIGLGFYRGNILIDNGRIDYIGGNSNFEGLDRTIDAGGCLIIPGLVNAHLHSHDHFNKGGFDNKPLEVWMTYLRPYYSGIGATADEIYTRTLWGCVEMIKNGTTTIIDDIVQTPYNDEEKLDAIMRAYEKAGMRTFVTTHIGNKAIEETIPYLTDAFQEKGFTNKSAPPAAAADILAYAESMLQKYNRPGRLQRYALSPSGPQRCTDELLSGLAALALKYRVPGVCHTLETYVQKVAGQHFFGKTLIEHMDEVGALNEYMNLIHCVWVTEGDIEIMAGRGVKVVHNPSSNMKLGSGIAPVRKMLDAGIPVGIGTDNTSCNDSINLFHDMRASALIHKVTTADYSKWLGADDALSMATIGGARCAGIADATGTIEAGKRADLTIIDMDNERYTPLNRPVNHLVFCDNGSSVRDVFVDGKIVMENRKITTFDEREVMDEIRRIMPKMHEEQDLAGREADEITRCLAVAYARANESRS